MPILSTQRVTKSISLPNPKGAMVTVVDTLTIGDFVGVRDGTVDETEIFIKMLPKIITGWNLTDEHGTTLPITRETIQMLPIESMNALNEHFAELADTKKKSGNSTEQ